MKQNIAKIFLALPWFFVLINPIQSSEEKELIAKIKEAIKSRAIAYRLTEPEEIKILLGEPLKQTEAKEGGMQMLGYEYPDLQIAFWKMRNDSAPFTLRRIYFKEERVDIGEDKKITLRTNDDLRKIDRFWGLADVSLLRLDLGDKKEFLDSMTFDTLTEWPPEEKLPGGFHPAELIENAKSPGLGVRSLHQKGIDGTGVGIAIIDQPLLLGHVEYTSKINRYDETGLGDMTPQMHGSPVTSIALGENIGVAPGASLTYFAVPMWEQDNMLYIDTLKKIFELNRSLPEKEKIRVVSISTGVFSGQPHYEEWEEALKQADAQGILVVTCDQAVLDYGILSLSPGKDPNDPNSYKPGIYVSEGDVIRVPGANKTVASHRGADVYTFDRSGGMSWGAPYIAGLAALAFQVDPEITPKEIIQFLVGTVIKTECGPIANPPGFIEAIQENKVKKQI